MIFTNKVTQFIGSIGNDVCLQKEHVSKLFLKVCLFNLYIISSITHVHKVVKNQITAIALPRD